MGEYSIYIYTFINDNLIWHNLRMLVCCLKYSSFKFMCEIPTLDVQLNQFANILKVDNALGIFSTMSWEFVLQTFVARQFFTHYVPGCSSICHICRLHYESLCSVKCWKKRQKMKQLCLPHYCYLRSSFVVQIIFKEYMLTFGFYFIWEHNIKLI